MNINYTYLNFGVKLDFGVKLELRLLSTTYSTYYVVNLRQIAIASYHRLQVQRGVAHETVADIRVLK